MLRVAQWIGWLLMIVVVPGIWFLAQVLLVPNCKAERSVLSTLSAGALAFAPLVVWAMAALFRREALGWDEDTPAWARRGILVGALVSTTCVLAVAGQMYYLAMGLPLLVPTALTTTMVVRARAPLASHDLHIRRRAVSALTAGLGKWLCVGAAILMVVIASGRVLGMPVRMFEAIAAMSPIPGVPILVSTWYQLRAWEVLTARPEGGDLGTSAAAYAANGVAVAYTAAHLWSTLPDQCGDCFVVTAATRGDPRVVGPLFPVVRSGRVRLANTQLLTFWRFEDAWAAWSPRTHRAFRRVYSVIGPRVAARTNTRARATAMFLVLAPLAFVAARVPRNDEARLAAGSK